MAAMSHPPTTMVVKPLPNDEMNISTAIQMLADHAIIQPAIKVIAEAL